MGEDRDKRYHSAAGALANFQKGGCAADAQPQGEGRRHYADPPGRLVSADYRWALTAKR
jgi:hypothetical protein